MAKSKDDSRGPVGLGQHRRARLLLATLFVSVMIPAVKTTCTVIALLDSDNTAAGTEIPQGESTTWQCRTGFVNDTLSHEGTYQDTCRGTGADLRASGTCSPILCSVAGLTGALRSAISVSYGAAATWTCELGRQTTSGIGGGAYQSAPCDEIGAQLSAANDETCTVFTCPIVEVSDASTDVQGTQLGYNEEVTWECDEHFETSITPRVYGGSYTASCDAPGSVTAAGTCIQVDCAINALDDATSAPGSSLNHGETVTWTCNSGFNAADGSHQGIYTARCGDSGFALTAPEGCTQITCPVENINSAAETPSSRRVNFGDSASWRCNRHYKNGTNGVHRGTFASAGSCGESGARLNSPGSCRRITCNVNTLDDATNPPASVNHGDDVIWLCAQGYKNGTGNSAVHRGTFTATCGDDGDSLTASDSCVQITCDVPPHDSYATVDANAVVLFGDRLTYTCLSGHVLSNPERGGFSTDTVNSITCNLNTAQNNGRYTPRPTVCTLGCVDGQYTNNVGGCLSCDDTCDFAGSEYESQTCAAMDNRRCASCSRGSYREVLDSNGFADGCVTCSTTCAQGQQIIGDCQRTGLTSDPLSCTSCAPGTFSASQTIGSDHLNPCVNCGAGYICPYSSGDTSATTKRPCTDSDEFMAENDGTTCSSVLDGHYTVSQDGLSNTPDSVPHVGQVICERGRRCPTSGADKGRRFDCDASRGEFQRSPGATSCESVTSGWYTTPIDETLRTGQVQCARGYMCNPATGVRTKCGPNTFTSELGATTCRPLTDTYFVVVKDSSVDQLRIAEVEAIAGQFVVPPTADSDGDRYVMPCGLGYQCPYRGDRTPCDNNVTFSEVLVGSACLPCYRCPSSETITAECIPTQDTVCNDTVPPVLESARQRITLEAVSDPVYGTFGESDPVTAYDDRSTADDRDARQLLTDRIHRSSDSSFITPPPSSCSYETERCSFVSPVNMTLVGTHLVTYTVRDNSDNSLTATRVVRVVDTTPPVITLNNDAEIGINVQEDPFADLLDDRYIQRATASDTLDDLLGRTWVPVVPHDDRERLLEAIGVASDGVTVWNATRMNAAERLRPEGWRLVYGGVIDWNGNRATDVTQTFILRDVSAPQITANNASYEWNAVRNSNQPFAGFPVDYGATAIDFVYGDLSSTVAVQSDGGYTLAALGNYIITYHVADPAGNSATATAVVSVVDKLPPVMTLRTGTCLEAWCNVVCTSASECDVNYGSTWSDPGVDVADTFATQDQLNVNVRGALVQTSVGAGFTFTAPTAALLATAVPLDTSAPLGTRFVLSYNVADPEQNTAVTRTRTVTIVDVSPPRFPQLDGNATIIDITSGDFYDEAASCPYAVDNFDGRIDAPCVYYNASIDTQRTNGTVYRQNFDYWNETRFRVLGEFNVTYFVVDTNGNTGTANRTFSVSSAIEASEATDGIGGGGIAGIVIVVLLMVVLVPVAVVAMQRRKLQQSKSGVTGPSNGMTEFKSPVFAEAAAMPPPPESWFHGDIDRTLAEERLRGAADSVDGVYLVRTRNSNNHSASYALSMLIDGRIIHYALSIPQDGQAPLLIQNVPTLHEWGTCLHDIIATLYHVQQGCTVTSGLRTPVPIPSSARDIASMYGPSTASEVYRKITLSPSLYTLSTAFEIERDGIFYRIFVPPDRVPVEVMLYTAKRSAAKEFEIVDRAAVDPWTPVYVRVTPEQLRGLVGATASDDDYDSFDPTKFEPSVGGNRSRMAAPGEVIYDSNGQVASDQPLPPSGAMYTTVSKGTAFAIPQADDDHSVSSGNVATPADEGGVMYSSIVVTQPRSAGSTDFAGFEDFDESNDGDVVYSAVDHSNGAIDGDVMYSAVDHNNGAAGIGVTANDGTGIIYSAVDHAPAVRGAIPAENGDVVYSAVAHDSAAPAPVMAGSGAMYAAVDKRGGNRGARPAALPKPSPPEWLHTVNRVEAEAILLEAGGSDGIYLVRPKDPGYAMSIILRGRFVHRLIEPKPNGQFVVDRQGGDWGTTLSDVVLHLENEMRQKHGLNSVRPVLAGTVDDDFDGFC